MAEADQRAESITADGTHSRGEDAMMMFAREGLDKKVVLTTDANGEKHLPSLSGEAIDEKNAMPRVMKALKPLTLVMRRPQMRELKAELKCGVK